MGYLFYLVILGFRKEGVSIYTTVKYTSCVTSSETELGGSGDGEKKSKEVKGGGGSRANRKGFIVISSTVRFWRLTVSLSQPHGLSLKC